MTFCCNVQSNVALGGRSARPIEISSFAVFVESFTFSQLALDFASFYYFFSKRNAIRGENARRGREGPRALGVPRARPRLARGSTTGRALRSESEDRLIASSVDEEAEKEVVGRPEPRAIRHCNNHVSSPARIPRDGSPAWPRRMRLDTTENRAVQ